MKASLSVIICTFNRCNSLADTLESVARLEVPVDLDWDLIVVDNNSSDRTREIVDSFAKRVGFPVRYVFEPEPGLSRARNAGVNATTKDYIAFTDDDVLVERSWLRTIIETFLEYQADCVGGKVLPHWLERRPEWLTDNLLSVLAMLNYGDKPFRFDWKTDKRILFGANFSFRRSTLVELGLFNVELGRKGGAGVGEDKEMFDKLKQTGRVAVYNPQIVVLHKAPVDRMTKEYFRSWYYVAGRDRAKVTRANASTIFGIERDLFVHFARSATRLIGGWVRGRNDASFADQLHCILYLSVFRHKLLK